MNDSPQAVADGTEQVAVESPAPNPARKIILIVIAVLLGLFVYHVIADRYTPYTSQARVETFMTQIAPEVAGDVLYVGVRDNSRVRQGQVLFRIDPEVERQQAERVRAVRGSRSEQDWRAALADVRRRSGAGR